MIDNPKIGKFIIGAVVAALVAIFAFAALYNGSSSSSGISQKYETTLFDTSSVINMNVDIDEDDWADLIKNATSEEYYKADITINGTTYENCGIRAKGNTSLSMVASSDSDRYSFKVKFDEYVDGQNCDGLYSLVLNNNYSDATMMKEAITYDMFQFLDVDASLYNYSKISINGEYWGCYLALEPVDDNFFIRNYGATNGNLYKPDTMEMGAGRGMMKNFDKDDVMDMLGLNDKNDTNGDNTTNDKSTDANTNNDSDGDAKSDANTNANDSNDTSNGTNGAFPGGGNMPNGNAQNGNMQNGEPPEMPNGESANGGQGNTNGTFPGGNMQGGPGAQANGDTQNGNTQNGEPPEMPNGETPNTDNSDNGNTTPPTMPNNGANGNDAGNGNANGGQNGANGGGPGQSGSGSNLTYTDDSLDSYSAIWDGAVTETSDVDHQRVVTALKNICSDNVSLETLEKYMNVENILKYMAVHTFVVNLDSLTGTMEHNYYLYESGGQINLIPWDYNLAYGGFQGKDASEMVNFPIDTPFSESITEENRKLFYALLNNEECLAKYHEYLEQLCNEYVYGGKLTSTYNTIRSNINKLVKNDPTSFYSYSEYTTACKTLIKVIKLRASSVLGQIDGSIPSTHEGQNKDSSNLIKCSGINLSVMGTQGGGKDGGRKN